jgi:hypothetical protein
MKQEFDFYIDEKITIWNRFKFSVEAETLDEAKEKAKMMTMNEREDIDFDDSLLLYDTMEVIEPQENDGNSTLELFCKEDDELLYENSDKEIWENTNRKNYITP